MSQSRAGRDAPKRAVDRHRYGAEHGQMADLEPQARFTVVCRTRPVTSLTPRSRLLVSDLVLKALARVGVVDLGRTAAGLGWCCGTGGLGDGWLRYSMARPLVLGPRQHKHRRCAGVAMDW